MTDLITKQDLEQELKISFESTYTDAYFLELANFALGELETATNRTSFTGNTNYLAKKAMLAAVMDWLSMFDPQLFALYVTSISEDGASLSIASDKTLASYKSTFERLVARLRLPSTSNYNVIIPDITGDHTGTETSILY